MKCARLIALVVTLGLFCGCDVLLAVFIPDRDVPWSLTVAADNLLDEPVFVEVSGTCEAGCSRALAVLTKKRYELPPLSSSETDVRTLTWNLELPVGETYNASNFSHLAVLFVTVFYEGDGGTNILGEVRAEQVRRDSNISVIIGSEGSLQMQCSNCDCVECLSNV